MSELSEMTSFWASVKGFVASAVGSVFREEEAVDVGPGSVTVRPYFDPEKEEDPGTQELRHLAGAVVRPGDRVVVLRLPALKLVLGTPTVRGVASVIPLPFRGYGAGWGTADEAARADHHHELPLRANQWYGPATHGAGVASVTTRTLTALRHHGAAMYVPAPMPIRDLKIDVTAAVAGSTATLAVYASSPAGLPSALRASVSVDTATTGIRLSGNATTLATLEPGWYWVTILPSHAITIRTAVPARYPMGMSANTMTDGWAYQFADRADTTPPALFGTAGVGSLSYPLVDVQAK